MVHLRPASAIDNPADILNRRLSGFAIDQMTLTEALVEVHARLRPELRGGGVIGSGPSPTPLGLVRFSVSTDETTLEGILDAIVIAHGESSWSVLYRRDDAGELSFSISFHTFDGWGTEM